MFSGFETLQLSTVSQKLGNNMLPPSSELKEIDSNLEMKGLGWGFFDDLIQFFSFH